MQEASMITEISLLGHLRIEFFCLKMDFKKKEPDVPNKKPNRLDQG